MPDLFPCLFPDSGSVYTLEEIANCVSKSVEQAREAQNTLSSRIATRDLVQPLDNRRPAHYSPEGARLIARHICRGTERDAVRDATRQHLDMQVADLLDLVAANAIALARLTAKLDTLIVTLVTLVELVSAFRKKT